MDKGLRNTISKNKQKQRLKTHKDSTWMDESFIGRLKNHDDHNNNLRPKTKYKRPKYKDMGGEDE